MDRFWGRNCGCGRFFEKARTIICGLLLSFSTLSCNFLHQRNLSHGHASSCEKASSVWDRESRESSTDGRGYDGSDVTSTNRCETRPDIQLDEGVLDDWDAFPGDPLTGKWTNNSPWASGLTKFEISKDGDGYHISAKGACFPTDCEWASVDLYAVGTSVEDTTPDFAIGKWDFDFKETTVTVEIVDHGLVVDLYSVFKDDSGRLPYHDSYWLNDDGDMIDVKALTKSSVSNRSTISFCQLYRLGNAKFSTLIVQ